MINFFKKKQVRKESTNPLDTMRFSAVIKPINKTEENDVFIVGFPKSGNTLMQQIVVQLVYGLNNEASRTIVELIAPDIYANSHYFRFNERCYFKSHELPKEKYKKVIYMIRDGREALLSYYHMKKNLNHQISIEDLYTENHKIFNTTWGNHIKSWEENPFNADILFVKFEDLKNNKLKELSRICKFLNIERNSSELETTIELTSFDYMKSLEKRKDWSFLKKGLFKEGKNFVRSGRIDSYKEEVKDALLSKFEINNKSLLEKYYPDEPH